MRVSTTAAFILLVLSGCANTPNPEYQESLDSWVGAPLVEFFSLHREPDSMIDMIDYRIYVWDETKIVTGSAQGNTVCTPGATLPMGGTTAPNCQTYGGGAYSSTYSCAWKLRTREHVIMEVELIGDACNAETRPMPRPAP